MPTPFPTLPAADRAAHLLGVLLAESGELLDRRLEDTAGSGGATPAAILSIATWPDRSVDFLAGVLGRSHSGTVRLVDRLVRDGHVEREPGADRRSLSLRLTSSGQAMAAHLRTERSRYLAELVEPLDATATEALASSLESLLEGHVRTRTAARRACRLCDHRCCRDDDCPVGRSVESESVDDGGP